MDIQILLALQSFREAVGDCADGKLPVNPIKMTVYPWAFSKPGKN